MDRLAEARKRHEGAEERFNSAKDAVLDASPDITEEDLTSLTTEFDSAEEAYNRSAKEVERMERIYAGRKETPVLQDERNEITTEPDVYRKDDRSSSWVLDVARTALPGSTTAVEKLQRNNEAVRLQNWPNLTAEERVVVTQTDAGFTPPLWVTDQYIALARPHRVYADACNRSMVLPPYGDSINIPKVNTGTSAAVAADNASVSSTDIGQTQLTMAVQLIAGQNDVSRSAIERSAPGLADVILADLAADYSKQLDIALLNGSVTNAKGFLQDSNRIQLSTTTGSGTLMQSIFQGFSQITSQCYMEPQAIFMHPRRWFYFQAQQDTSNRPWVLPAEQGPYNANGVVANVVAEAYAGSIGHVPVFLDPNIPTNLGGGSEDAILISRVGDNMLLEDNTGIRNFRFEGVLSANANIRLQVVGYYAYGHRYGKSNCSIGGTGLQAPAGF